MSSRTRAKVRSAPCITGARGALLGALVDAKFLSKTRDGAFVRSDFRVAS